MVFMMFFFIVVSADIEVAWFFLHLHLFHAVGDKSLFICFVVFLLVVYVFGFCFLIYFINIGWFEEELLFQG